MTDEAHAALAAVLQKCQAKVAVSSYHSPLNDEIFKGWRCIEAAEKLCHSVKALRQEVLFVNYDPGDLTPDFQPQQESLLASEDE